MLHQSRNTIEHPLLSSLNKEEKELLLNNMQDGSHPPKEYLYKDDGKMENIYFIKKGTVLVGNNLGKLNEFTFQLSMQPLFLGLESLVLKEGNQQFAKTLSHVDFITISKNVFIYLLQTNVSFHYTIQEQLARSYRYLESKYHILRSNTNYIHRLKTFLEDLHNENLKKINQSERITLCITHMEISKYLQCSRQSVSTSLAQLRKEGIINYGRNEIYIKDLSRLRDWES